MKYNLLWVSMLAGVLH